jgi:hypothetical protein
MDAPVAGIPASLHAEIQAVLDTGLDIDCHLAGNQLTLRLVKEIPE